MSLPDWMDVDALLADALARLPQREALVELLELRAVVAEASEVDAALVALDEATLLQAGLSPGPTPLLDRLEALDEPDIEEELDSTEEVVALLELLDTWGLRAEGLERAGCGSVAGALRGHRLVLTTALLARPHLLYLLVEVAQERAEASPLGARSAWRAVCTELRGALGRIDEEDQDGLSGGPPAAEPWSPVVVDFPTLPGQAVHHAEPTRERLDRILQAAAADDGGGGPPEFDPPAPGALAWVFEDGSRLTIERAGSRWLVRLVRGARGLEARISGVDLRVWDDGLGILALVSPGGLRAQSSDETVVIALAGED